MTGLSARNLKYMRAFAEAWPDVEVVQQHVALLPCSIVSEEADCVGCNKKELSDAYMLDNRRPHGAGKTTFALEYLPQVAHCSRFVNADLIAAGLSPLAPEREWVAASAADFKNGRNRHAPKPYCA